MSRDQERIPIAVYMLADHLDSALAAGEDLMAAAYKWRDAIKQPASDAAALNVRRELLEDVRTYELMLIARCLRARTFAHSLAEMDERFQLTANLFVGGTAVFVDAVEDAGDSRAIDFDTGDGQTTYIRGRGLMEPDTGHAVSGQTVVVDENFMVATRIALGPLLDMVASLLDALDVYYDLFEDADAQTRETDTPFAKAIFDGDEQLPVN